MTIKEISNYLNIKERNYMEDKILKIGSNELELVDFRLFGIDNKGNIYERIYGINVTKVKEIIKMPEITKLPGNEIIEGIFDLRGIPIPVIDLAKWLNIEVPVEKMMEIKKRVIITEFNNTLIGFIVHDAKKLEDFLKKILKLQHLLVIIKILVF